MPGSSSENVAIHRALGESRSWGVLNFLASVALLEAWET